MSSSSRIETPLFSRIPFRSLAEPIWRNEARMPTLSTNASASRNERQRRQKLRVELFVTGQLWSLVFEIRSWLHDRSLLRLDPFYFSIKNKLTKFF